MKQQNSGGAVWAGSWEYRAGSSPHFQGQIYDEAGKTVAISYDDEGGSRAQLIASAPELLATLKLCFARMQNKAATCKNADWKASDQRAYDATRAAIAKAEGVTP